jgi:hypothetical protein
MTLLCFRFRYSLLDAMSTLDRGSNLLQETESKLRGLVSEAAASGDYASVVQITSWARTLSELVNREATTKVNGAVPVPRSAQSGAKGPKQLSLSRWGQRSYPLFFRQGDQIVRIAWSKREKKEYRHKAAYGILKVLTKSMVDKGADGRVFATEQFLPVRDAQGAEVPNYQAYVGIALFKQAGLIDQHGRQGYSIPRLADFKDAVEAVWKKLPELQDK